MDPMFILEDVEIVRRALEAVWLERFHGELSIRAPPEIIRDVLVSCGVPPARIEQAIAIARTIAPNK